MFFAYLCGINANIHRMPSQKTKGSLSGIVDKMNATYDGIVNGFSLGVNRRIVPVMTDGEVTGWKIQCLENNEWVEMDEVPFATIRELIEYYKDREQ